MRKGGLLLLLSSLCVMAGPIGPAAFVQPLVETYSGLGLPFDNATPIIIDGNTYMTDDGVLRYGTFGACFSNPCIGSNTSGGWIDIVLGTPTLRAGGYVGFGSGGSMSFFDESNALLGTVSITSSFMFAGWQADSGLIARMLINDGVGQGNIVEFDNLTVETVPEPTSCGLTAAIIVGVLLRNRRRERG